MVSEGDPGGEAGVDEEGEGGPPLVGGEEEEGGEGPQDGVPPPRRRPPHHASKPSSRRADHRRLQPEAERGPCRVDGEAVPNPVRCERQGPGSHRRQRKPEGEADAEHCHPSEGFHSVCACEAEGLHFFAGSPEPLNDASSDPRPCVPRDGRLGVPSPPQVVRAFVKDERPPYQLVKGSVDHHHRVARPVLVGHDVAEVASMTARSKRPAVHRVVRVVVRAGARASVSEVAARVRVRAVQPRREAVHFEDQPGAVRPFLLEEDGPLHSLAGGRVALLARFHHTDGVVLPQHLEVVPPHQENADSPDRRSESWLVHLGLGGVEDNAPRKKAAHGVPSGRIRFRYMQAQGRRVRRQTKNLRNCLAHSMEGETALSLFQATGILKDCVDTQADVAKCGVCGDDLNGNVYATCDFPVPIEKVRGSKKQFHTTHIMCEVCNEKRDHVGEKGACAVCLKELGGTRTAIKCAGVAKLPAQCIGVLGSMIKSLREAQVQIKSCQDSNDDARIAEGSNRRAAAVEEVRKKREEAEADATRVKAEAEAEAARVKAEAKAEAEAEATRVKAEAKAETTRAAEEANKEADRLKKKAQVEAEEAKKAQQEEMREAKKAQQEGMNKFEADWKKQAEAARVHAMKEAATITAQAKEKAEGEMGKGTTAASGKKKESNLAPEDLERRRESAKRKREDTKEKLQGYDNAMAKVSLLNSMCDMHLKKLKALFELAEAHAMDPDTLAEEWTTMQREMDKEEVMEADDSEEEEMEPLAAEEETREEVAADA